MSIEMRAGRRTVTVSKPDKELYPGIDKERIARYYAMVAPLMIPFVRERPVTMERYPDGIGAHMIYQKNTPKYFPDWIRTATMRKRDGVVRHPLANDPATLVYLANQAALALHVTAARADKPHVPDLVVFDLDPSGDDFGVVRKTALAIKERLEGFGLVPFCKTSGSKGLHVVAPIRRRDGFDATHAFAQRIAQELIDEQPGDLTFEFSKADRGGRIYMDVGRNGYGATFVAPYSLRGLPDAPVSAPVTWDEVADPALTPRSFTLANMESRIDDTGDVWESLRGSAKPLPR